MSAHLLEKTNMRMQVRRKLYLQHLTYACNSIKVEFADADPTAQAQQIEHSLVRKTVKGSDRRTFPRHKSKARFSIFELTHYNWHRSSL